MSAIHIDLRVKQPDLHIQTELPGRGISAIFGPSGSGKTTLLRAIAGLQEGVCGHLQVAGECWQQGPRGLPAAKRAVGMVFQQGGLLPHLSVLDNLRYGWRRVGGSEQELAACIARLDLTNLLERKPVGLSGGERQRVALARALLTRPKLLLLDEPLAALDIGRRMEILPYLEELKKQDLPVLYVTHSVEEVARLADHLLLIEQGRLCQAGPALTLLNRGGLPTGLGEDAAVVLEAKIAQGDGSGLLLLDAPLGRLYAYGAGHASAGRLRLRILARDVSLALQYHADTSLQNILPATVTGLHKLANGQVQVALTCGSGSLLAHVSQRASEHLQLREGLALWAQIKAVALLV